MSIKMTYVVLMLLVLLQVEVSYQQNILPEHKRRHCKALQTADIMEHALPEIRAILRAEVERLRRQLQGDILPEIRRLIQTELESIKGQPEGDTSQMKGVVLMKCDPGWVYNDDNCYLFSQSYKTWSKAIEKCGEMNSYLADVQSDEENRFLKMELSKRHKASRHIWNIYYYIGGYLSKTEHEWIWERTSEIIGYNDWAADEPNNAGGNENCLTLQGAAGFKWNDLNCTDNETNFICKKRVEYKLFP